MRIICFDCLKTNKRIIKQDKVPKWFVNHCRNWKAYSYNNLFKYWRSVDISKQDLYKIRKKLKRNRNTVAVIGSVGKSTIVKILSKLLNNAGYYSFATKTNDNWLPKIPLAAYLSLKKPYKIRIFECGATRKGDMKALSFLIPAKFILLTEITSTHLAALESLQGVINEKLSFFQKLNKAFIVSHINNKVYLSENNIKPLYYGEKGTGADYFFSNVKTSFKKTTFILGKKREDNFINIKIAGFGRYLACEVAGAVAMFEKIVGRSITRNELRILKKIKPTKRRMEIVKRNNINFIIDTANANRVSILNSLESFLEAESRNPKAIILGHFSGMGDSLPTEIDYLSNKIIKLPLNKLSSIYLIGDEFSRLFEKIRKKFTIKVKIFSDLHDALININLKELKGYTVLLRGPSMAKKNLVLMIPKYRNFSDETYYIKK